MRKITFILHAVSFRKILALCCKQVIHSCQCTEAGLGRYMQHCENIFARSEINSAKHFDEYLKFGKTHKPKNLEKCLI